MKAIFTNVILKAAEILGESIYNVIYNTEKYIYLNFGVMLPFLRKEWSRIGKMRQRSLNWEHDTEIEYKSIF